MRTLATRTIAALAMALVPLVATEAGTDTASLSVGATVVLNCKINVGTLTFADYTSGQAANSDAVGNLTYTGCQNASMKVELNAGANDQTSSRGMKNAGGAILRYQLFQNSTRTTTVGTGTAALNLTAPSTGSGTIPIYGRIPGGQTLAPGAYADTVSVVMTF